jgi:hypothetical protein
MSHKTTLFLKRFLLNTGGRFVVESTITVPIVLILTFLAYGLVIHSFSNSIQSFVTNRSTLYAVDHAGINSMVKQIKFPRYMHVSLNIFSTIYTAKLASTENSQEYTNPTTRIRQVIWINNITKSSTTPYDEQASMKFPLTFISHYEAAKFLRQFVQGQQEEVNTPYGMRLLDASLSNKIVHQAFVTYSESQLYLQARKDQWLVNNKKLNGVIWHFYMRDAYNYRVPSETLIHDLNRMGIVVYVHIPR